MAENPFVSPRITLSDFPDEIDEYFYSHGYTDGLPIVPPSVDRVKQFVEATGKRPQEVVGLVPPLMGSATVERVAINAVMAGCRPEYMPTFLAAVSAVCDPQFNLSTIQSTTNPASPLLILNGPQRKRLDVNSGSGCFGPGWRANATIGRALRLVLLNVGGGKPGVVDKATQGYPGKYTFCFAENEEESPWEPLAVERGFAPADDTITAVGGHGTSNIVETSPRAEDVLTSLAFGLINTGVNNFMNARSDVLLVLCPSHAQIIANGGKFTKQMLKEYLWERARAPFDWFSERRQSEIRLRKATILNDRVLITDRPENFIIVIAGGPGGLHSTFIPTVTGTQSVTRPIRSS